MIAPPPHSIFHRNLDSSPTAVVFRCIIFRRIFFFFDALIFPSVHRSFFGSVCVYFLCSVFMPAQCFISRFIILYFSMHANVHEKIHCLLMCVGNSSVLQWYPLPFYSPLFIGRSLVYIKSFFIMLKLRFIYFYISLINYDFFIG